MTQVEFDQLPGLLRRKTFLQVTGLERRALRKLLEARQVRIIFVGRHGMYYKRDAARLTGFILR